MSDRMSDVRARFAELEHRLGDPEVLARPELLAEIARAHAQLAPVVKTLDALDGARRDAVEAAELAASCTDPDERAFYADTQAEAEAAVATLDAELQELLIPPDPLDDRDILVEVRAAAGGDEASLFCAELARTYQRYAERHGWRGEILSSQPTPVGGFREVVLGIAGHGAWSGFKFEGGTHRVQRVPATEAQGRIHTSTVTVAVLVEADEVEVELRPEDLAIDVFRSSGPGGQSVNTTDSAVRITHKPSGLVVSCQDEKSQLQNKAKALRILRARLAQQAADAAAAEVAADRRTQVGSGMRAEKVRTYNFAQNRVTDHRLGMSVYDLASVLDGDLDAFCAALVADERARTLAADGDEGAA